MLLLLPQRYVFSSKSQQQTVINRQYLCCCCYHKGTYFQANHNQMTSGCVPCSVVVATTKVRIFKQITTEKIVLSLVFRLLLLPQRYVFSSKSQRHCVPFWNDDGCCCYHKGTYFQANHNRLVLIFNKLTLLLLPQRYVFSSKSQLRAVSILAIICCCCYHKGTYFQANHNLLLSLLHSLPVVVATTKVRIFKQITT